MTNRPLALMQNVQAAIKNITIKTAWQCSGLPLGRFLASVCRVTTKCLRPPSPFRGGGQFFKNRYNYRYVHKSIWIDKSILILK